jgi:hypothetical protein
MMTSPSSPSFAFDEASHRYHLDGKPLPSVTTVLADAGLLKYDFLDEHLRETCLERGRQVHMLTQLDDEGRLDEDNIGEENLDYLLAWRKFKKDFEFTPRLIEHKVFHPMLKYAGCLDRVGRARDGRELLIDIKTGVAPHAARYQTAAYAACLPHPRTYARRVVELRPDLSYRVIAFNASDYWTDFTVFTGALRAFKAKEGV